MASLAADIGKYSIHIDEFPDRLILLTRIALCLLFFETLHQIVF